MVEFIEFINAFCSTFAQIDEHRWFLFVEFFFLFVLFLILGWLRM